MKYKCNDNKRGSTHQKNGGSHLHRIPTNQVLIISELHQRHHQGTNNHNNSIYVAGTDCQDLGHDTGEEENLFDDGLNLYEVVGRNVHSNNTKRPAPKESSTPVRATNVTAVYASVDKSNKTGTKKTGDESMFINKHELYYMLNQ